MATNPVSKGVLLEKALALPRRGSPVRIWFRAYLKTLVNTTFAGVVVLVGVMAIRLKLVKNNIVQMPKKPGDMDFEQYGFNSGSRYLRNGQP